jgi:hypothetical protein
LPICKGPRPTGDGSHPTINGPLPREPGEVPRDRVPSPGGTGPFVVCQPEPPSRRSSFREGSHRSTRDEAWGWTRSRRDRYGRRGGLTNDVALAGEFARVRADRPSGARREERYRGFSGSQSYLSTLARVIT